MYRTGACSYKCAVLQTGLKCASLLKRGDEVVEALFGQNSFGELGIIGPLGVHPRPHRTFAPQLHLGFVRSVPFRDFLLDGLGTFLHPLLVEPAYLIAERDARGSDPFFLVRGYRKNAKSVLVPGTTLGGVKFNSYADSSAFIEKFYRESNFALNDVFGKISL